MEAEQLDRMFAALADPTRRRILQQVEHSELTVNEIAAAHAMSLPAVSKHLKVLENAGLLQRTKAGRQYYCSFNPAALRAAVDWLSRTYAFWNEQFDSLEEYFNSHESDDE